MKKFNIPAIYKSSFIGQVKELRKISDPRKKDFSPTVLDFGNVQFFLARHFGFCYGVENAIEISYKTIEENPGKRIFLLSQMIHNPEVNRDLIAKGLKFILDTSGKQLINWEELNADDIVIIPAFGTTLKTEEKLKEIGIKTENYNTTCPFVKKVWNTSAKLGEKNYTIIIHGKANHEETKATFSHADKDAPSVIIKNMAEAKIIGEVILGKRPLSDFTPHFIGKHSALFNPQIHLNRIGVVNQTTMLAIETHEIAQYFKQVMVEKYGEQNLANHFADTRDTLCYATNDNQDATYGLLNTDAHLAIVVGGYNSSNTSHLVELLEQKFKTYYISTQNEIVSENLINHYNFHTGQMEKTNQFLPNKNPLKIILTSGASCPDTLVDDVLDKILSFLNPKKSKEKVLDELNT